MTANSTTVYSYIMQLGYNTLIIIIIIIIRLYSTEMVNMTKKER